MARHEPRRASEMFGTRGSPYGDGLFRRAVTQEPLKVAGNRDTYSLSGVSAAVQTPSMSRPPSFAVGMQSLARDCQCNGFAVGSAVERIASSHARFAHASVERIEELVAGGVSVPPALVAKLAREAAELADIRTLLEARLILAQGGKLTLEQAQRFQDAARRLGLLKGGAGRGRKKKRKGGLGAMLVGACCGAVESVLSVGGGRKKKAAPLHINHAVAMRNAQMLAAASQDPQASSPAAQLGRIHAWYAVRGVGGDTTQEF